jgi:hypothetical protein
MDHHHWQQREEEEEGGRGVDLAPPPPPAGSDDADDDYSSTLDRRCGYRLEAAAYPTAAKTRINTGTVQRRTPNGLLLQRLLLVCWLVIMINYSYYPQQYVVPPVESFQVATTIGPTSARRHSLLLVSGYALLSNDEKRSTSRRRRLSFPGHKAMGTDVSSSWKDLWGLERRATHSFPFPLDGPTLADQIVAAAWAAMTSSGNNHHFQDEPQPQDQQQQPQDQQQQQQQLVVAMDPNIVQNALLGDRVFGRRPVRDPVWDAGRIGIEIDGPNVNVMYVALLVAAQASLQQRQRYHHHRGVGSSSSVSSSRNDLMIPVAVYFDSVRETLAARALLQRLQQQQRGGTTLIIPDQVRAGLANVEIRSLVADNGRLPATMTMQQSNKSMNNSNDNNDDSNNIKKKHDSRPLAQRILPVDPTKGILLVVQPTEAGIMPLQRLSALATLARLPVVMLSPRMTREVTSPWDQSGYQQASAYGGAEPPTGPTPWLMRDFWPPVYSWIWQNDFGYTHSILHQKQSWDIFDCPVTVRSRRWDSGGDGGGDDDDTTTVACCHYLASTVNCAGRPTQDILRKIAQEYRQPTGNSAAK